MSNIPSKWTDANIDWSDLDTHAPVAGPVMGWVFYERPDHQDGDTLLALSLDHIGPCGPVVFDTNSDHVPDYI